MGKSKTLYPLEPGHQDTDTSADAAISMKEKASLLRRRCLALIREGSGLTSLEASRKLGEPHYNIVPRFSELRNLGQIKDSGSRRTNDYSGKNAIVWVAGQDPAIFTPKPLIPDKPAARQHYVDGMEAAAKLVEEKDAELAEEIRWAILRLPALSKPSRKKKTA